MLATIVVLLLTYGPGLLEGRIILPADMLEAFPPWTAVAPDPGPPANGLLGDQIQQMYPWRVFVHDELAAGRFPLWNPYAGAGVPLFANGQSAVLYPLNLAVVWMDPAIAGTIVQLLKPPLAAVGVALFLRALGAATAACAFGGLAWAFAGPMVVWLGWPHTNALLGVGYVFWTATRWLQLGTVKWWAASAVALGVQLLGGHPETTAHTVVATGVFVGAWALIAVWEGARVDPRDWRPLARALVVRPMGWVAAVAIGAALAAIQVVPTLAAITDSVTAAERGARSLAWILLEPETLLTWLLPNFFGTPLGTSFGPIEFLNYNETIGYVGIGTLVLALLSATAPRRPGWLPLAACTLVAAGLAYGIPGITELRRLPGLGHAANTRFVFILAFGIACLAGLGLDALLRTSRPWVRWLAAGIAALGALVALGYVLAPWLMTPSAVEAMPTTPLEAAIWRQGELRKAALLGALWVLAFGAVILGRVRVLASYACVAILALDLAVFSAGYNPTVKPEILQLRPESVHLIQDRGPEERVVGLGEALLPNAGMIHKLHDLRVYEPIAHRRLLDFFERLDPFLREDIRSRFYLFIWKPNVDMLSLASVRWVVVPHEDPRVSTAEELAAAGLIARYQDGVVAVWENPNARPRAYLADELVQVGDEHEAVARIPEIARAGGRGAVIERIPGVPAPPGARGEGEVRLEGWPGGARIGVIAPAGGGLLVLNDTYYPGWVASVDGAPAPILQTNHLFMGVPVPTGTHTVLLEYRPASVPVGAGMSLAAGITIIAVIIARRRYRATSAVLWQPRFR